MQRRITPLPGFQGPAAEGAGRSLAVGLCVLLAALAGCVPPDADSAAPESAAHRDVRWAIAIHGGAGVLPKTTPDKEKQGYLDSLSQALELGKTMLERGDAGLDVVEQVVRRMEDDPRFNAGKGAVFTHDGANELDASIMDGRDLSCGAVTGVTTVKNPISLARLVMERSKHVFFSGAGAERFADEMGVERVEPGYFFTQKRYDALQKALAEERDGADPPADTETVGVVVLDVHGNLAAGTSTGGLTNKRFGRIGDSPVIGAGTYANNRSCAVSGTGKGEQFIRHAVARDIAALVEYRGMSLREAAEAVVHGKLDPGDGGIIAVGADGSIAMIFNTQGMFRAAADSTGYTETKIWN